MSELNPNNDNLRIRFTRKKITPPHEKKPSTRSNSRKKEKRTTHNKELDTHAKMPDNRIPNQNKTEPEHAQTYVIPPMIPVYNDKFLKYETPQSRIKLTNDLYAAAYDKIYKQKE